MTADVDVDRLHANARTIHDAEGAGLIRRTSVSARLFERASTHLPMGVASSFQAGDPYPTYVSRGEGAHIWDADDNAYLDFHNGFGVTLCGHAHPKIVEAIDRAARTGTHFAAMTEAGIALGEELCRRFRLEQVRFSNTGTEATMEAIRVARAATGRSVVLKIEGAYHGHHDAVMFSVAPDEASLGRSDAPISPLPFSDGIPPSVAAELMIIPFNDAPALERALDARGPEIAALIMEPIMMFAGIVLPDPGYLEQVRELCTRHGVVLIFDEVKTGANVGPGGATVRFGVQPDLACFAKAIGGGVPIGAFGGSASVMDVIQRGEAHLGTFNGNPLAMHAGVAALTEVLTDDAYTHLSEISAQLADGVSEAIQDTGIPAHVVNLEAKGGVGYRPTPLHDYRDSFGCDDALLEPSSPWLMNRGIFQIPGDKGQWMLSIQHSEDDIATYVDAFAAYCAELVR